MKIIQIADNKIFGHGGGSIGEHEYYDAIKTYAQSHQCEFKVISIDKTFSESFPIKVKKTKLIDIYVRLVGHSTYIYSMWRRFKKVIIDYKPDVVFLGRSRMGFIAEDLKHSLPNCKIICYMVNVEYDYVLGYFANTASILKNIYTKIERSCTRRDEKKCLEYTDAIIYLSNRDYARAHELYTIGARKEMILPVCIKNQTKLEKNSKKKAVVFIGSLGYGSNVNALNDFIRNVWLPNFETRDDVIFIIGGSNANDDLKKLIKNIANCELYENFDNLEDVVPKGAMAIAPIQKGAGMKVKVAESLSMGLIIAASDEALVGYEDGIKDDKLNGIIRSNSPEDYIRAISSYVLLCDEELESISKQNVEIFEKYYSYSVSRKAIAALIDELNSGIV
jgi:glycosyltransferase involved in cell wall biosynthesis